MHPNDRGLGMEQKRDSNISSLSGGTSLSLIFFTKKVITTKMMTSKMTQVVHFNKDNDKMVITQLTHNPFISLMTHSKTRITIGISTKQVNMHNHLSKLMRIQDNYHSLIILTSLGVKGQGPHGRKKCPSTPKDFREKSPYFVVDDNSSTNMF